MVNLMFMQSFCQDSYISWKKCRVISLCRISTCAHPRWCIQNVHEYFMIQSCRLVLLVIVVDWGNVIEKSASHWVQILVHALELLNYDIDVHARVFGFQTFQVSPLLAQMVANSSKFLNIDYDWGERIPNEGRFFIFHFLTMYMWDYRMCVF